MGPGAGGRWWGVCTQVRVRASSLPSMPSAPQGGRPFPEAEMGPGYGDKNDMAWSRDKGAVDYSCNLFSLFPAGKESSVLNWQDCEVPSPQSHSREPSSQCVTTQLHPPPPPQLPATLPRSLGSEAGPLGQ